MPLKSSHCTSRLALSSKIAHAGIRPRHNNGYLAPPLNRASTIAFDDHDSLINERHPHRYGRWNSDNCDAVREVTNAIEGAENTILTSSGLSALTITLLAHLREGAHVLVTDAAYGGFRASLPKLASRFNAEVEYYHPCCGEELERLIKPNTCIIFAESPGSQTFEIPDLCCHIAIAKQYNIPIAVDNTWSAGVFLKPLEMGADYSIQSLTKFFSGHSDVLAGAIMFRQPKTAADVIRCNSSLGLRLAEDEAWLALRGSRSLLPRLATHSKNGEQVARWLEDHNHVAEVLHPALASHPQHDLWNRDFTGASSLFSFSLKDGSEDKLTAFMNALELFYMGFSWGGFDSLITSFDLANSRDLALWPKDKRGIRIFIGLHDSEDLIADLEQALDKSARA